VKLIKTLDLLARPRKFEPTTLSLEMEGFTLHSSLTISLCFHSSIRIGIRTQCLCIDHESNWLIKRSSFRIAQPYKGVSNLVYSNLKDSLSQIYVIAKGAPLLSTKVFDW